MNQFKKGDRVICMEEPQLGLMRVEYVWGQHRVQVYDLHGEERQFPEHRLRKLRIGDWVSIPSGQSMRITQVYRIADQVACVDVNTGVDTIFNESELTFVRSVDAEPCKMKNRDGSECGTCSCEGPRQCVFQEVSAFTVDDVVNHKVLSPTIPMIVKSIEGPKVLCHFVNNGRQQVWFDSGELTPFKDFGSCLGDGWTDDGIPVRDQIMDQKVMVDGETMPLAAVAKHIEPNELSKVMRATAPDLQKMSPQEYRKWRADRAIAQQQAKKLLEGSEPGFFMMDPSNPESPFTEVKVKDAHQFVQDAMQREMGGTFAEKYGGPAGKLFEDKNLGKAMKAEVIGEVKVELSTVFVKITPEQLREVAYDLEKTQEAQSYQNGEQTIFFLYPEKP